MLNDLTGIRLVVIGDGPEPERLTRALPCAKFTGVLTGTDLSRAMASLDVVVHPGPHETFCQVAQEAMARTWPVVCESLLRHYHEAARSLVVGGS